MKDLRKPSRNHTSFDEVLSPPSHKKSNNTAVGPSSSTATAIAGIAGIACRFRRKLMNGINGPHSWAKEAEIQVTPHDSPKSELIQLVQQQGEEDAVGIFI